MLAMAARSLLLEDHGVWCVSLGDVVLFVV